ncbi:hypothetical protein H5410_056111 [Solanum commersonii]|uniref:Uncharacterized protein n=1 Tax=Solanum commersonii TaxID=4109 RepID=A0A9J5WJD4_SOLCO|nr:hypothetical protein H5410_056111 [Solanum commersonii]
MAADPASWPLRLAGWAYEDSGTNERAKPILTALAVSFPVFRHIELLVINMVEVTLYFHHGGEWLTSPKSHYDKRWVYIGEAPDIVMHDESFLLLPIVNKGTDCSESGSDNGMEIVKGMDFKDIVEAKQFYKLYAMAKKVELVLVKSCPFLCLISRDLNTHGVSVKTLVDHIECGIAYDNSLVNYSIIAQYFTDKLQSDPKYKVKEMKVDLHRVFDLNVSEAKCKRAKREILETIDSSFVDSYNTLEALSNDKRKFLRMYICFKAMKLGSKSRLRPFIGLDGTHLKGKAKGHVLIVVDQDRLLDAIRTVLPEAHQRYCAKHIESNWCKRWGKEIKEVDEEVVANNFTESFNTWILEARCKQIIGMLEDIRVKIMERLAAKEVVVRKWKDDGLYLKISKVRKVSGNGDNGYEVTEGASRHIVNLREKKMYMQNMGSHWNSIPKLMMEREKNEAVKRQGVWKQTRKRKLLRKTSIAPQPTQENQSEFHVASSSYVPVAKDDDEDPRLRPRTISEETYLTRSRNRKNPQELIGSRVIGFRGDKSGVSEPTNLPIAPNGLTWNGKDAITTNQLQAHMIKS